MEFQKSQQPVLIAITRGWELSQKPKIMKIVFWKSGPNKPEIQNEHVNENEPSKLKMLGPLAF